MDNPLINLDKLSEPLTKLVDVTAAGIGTLYRPFGTVRQAKADARAKIISAEADAKVLTLEHRAKFRLEYRESLRQQNIEMVVSKAAAVMPDKVSKDSVDKDWILQFFGHAQDVCDEDMQTLWGKILAGETSKPRSYSKRTLQFLKTLDKWEAEMFSSYCSFLFNFEDGWKFVILADACIELIKRVLDGDEPTSHFVNIGLLSGADLLLTPRKIVGKTLYYFDQKYIFEGEVEKERFQLGIPIRHLTAIGQQISQIAGASFNDSLVKKISDEIGKRERLILKRV